MRRRYKAWIPALCLCLALVACGSEVEPEVEEEIVPVVPTITVTPQVEEPEEQEEEPVLLYVNPLTGEQTEEDISQNRPYAIMINNLKIALPQQGIGQADMIFECPAEGGITRMLAVFQSVEDVGEIGSVRSARDYYVSLACGLDAIFLHAGGSATAYTAIKTLGVTALDCVNGPYEGTLYWRDADRKASAGLEHSVVTSGETISQLVPTYTYLSTTHSDSYTPPFQFGETSSAQGGASGERLSVTYSYYKTGIFDYDADLGQYLVSQYDADYIDGNTGEQLAVKNVLVLRTDVEAIAGDTAGRLDIRLTGTGDGLFLCDGKAIEITWARQSDSDGFSLYTQAGEPLVLGVGTSYINVVDDSYEIHLD